jgi:hypothetical protein
MTEKSGEAQCLSPEGRTVILITRKFILDQHRGQKAYFQTRSRLQVYRPVRRFSSVKSKSMHLDDVIGARATPPG